jgi:hypothetical protein
MHRARRVFQIVAFLFALAVASNAEAQWTAVAAPGNFLDTCVLLTDGRVMCHVYNTNQWRVLTPDINGNYATGTWANTANMPNGTDTFTGPCNPGPCVYAPLYFASQVLPDGRVVIVGGEYLSVTGGTPVWTNIGFMYDPVADTWSNQLTVPATWISGNPNRGCLGDASSIVLENGTMLLANGRDCGGNGNVASFNPATLTFTALNPTGKQDGNNEENWTILPDGRILTIDATIQSQSEIYDPVANTWGNAANTQVNMADTGNLGGSAEIGPAVLRHDGTAIGFSGNSLGQNAVYDVATNTWTNTAAMDFVDSGTAGDGTDAVADGTASLLPNGNVLVMASPVTNASTFNAPAQFYEWDGTNLTQVTNSPNAASFAAYQGRMVLLPTGHVLLTAYTQQNTQDVMLYHNGGGPQDTWRPVITSAPNSVSPGTSYTISGRLFNGFSEGAYYGDDAQSSTNYPLVRIINRATGHVFYARTHDHSRMGVETPGTPDANEIVTTHFDTPAGMETGLADLEVVTNGIPSRRWVVNGPGLTLPGPLTLEACVGSTATATLNVCNTGKQDLVVNDITSSSPAVTVDDPGFSVVISPDFCFPFQVHFAPSATGELDATLTIDSNDANKPNAPVEVTATAAAPTINTTLVNNGVFPNTCPAGLSDAPILYVTNSGACSLTINDITSSSANFLTPTTGVPLPLTVGPHQTIPLPIRFQPVGLSCSDTIARTGVITIESNDPANGTLTQDVSGLVPCPKINSTLADVGAFGNVCGGGQKDLTLQLLNQGQCNLNISSILSSNPDFEVASVYQFPLVLSHDANVNIPIRYRPTGACSDTPELGAITVASNDPLTPNLVANVSGVQGCPNIVLSPENLTGLFAFPATVSDPTGNLGCYTDRQITVMNNGSCPLHVTSLTAGPSDTFNVITPTSAFLVAPGGSVPVTVRFKPTNLTGQLFDAPDEQTGSLTIVSDDPSVPAVALCGEPAVRSGIRVLVTDGASNPISPLTSLSLQSKGLSPQFSQKATDIVPSAVAVCGNPPIRFHVDSETLPPAGTTGSNPQASYNLQVRNGGKPISTSFTLGQCELKSMVLQYK